MSVSDGRGRRTATTVSGSSSPSPEPQPQRGSKASARAPQSAPNGKERFSAQCEPGGQKAQEKVRSAAKAAGGGKTAALVVSGCSDSAVAGGVHGQYEVHGSNHGRHAFRSIDVGQGFESFIYYWDRRDGPDYEGWWIGPTLGGQDVWVRNPGTVADRWPPRTGWFAPHDGPLDTTMVVETTSAGKNVQSPAPLPPAPAVPAAAPAPPPKRNDAADAAEAKRAAEMRKLEQSLESVRKEGEEQMRILVELQSSMQDRRGREERILQRMKTLVVSA